MPHTAGHGVYIVIRLSVCPGALLIVLTNGDLDHKSSSALFEVSGRP